MEPRIARTSRQSRLSGLSKNSVYSSKDILKWSKNKQKFKNRSSYLLSPAALGRRLKLSNGASSVVKDAILGKGSRERKGYKKLFG